MKCVWVVRWLNGRQFQRIGRWRGGKTLRVHIGFWRSGFSVCISRAAIHSFASQRWAAITQRWLPERRVHEATDASPPNSKPKPPKKGLLLAAGRRSVGASSEHDNERKPPAEPAGDETAGDETALETRPVPRQLSVGGPGIWHHRSIAEPPT